MTRGVLLDEHYAPDIAEGLRAKDIDAVPVAGHPHLESAPDDALLEWATHQEYCLLTENVGDFLPLFAQAIEQGGMPAGLILTSTRRFPRDKQRTGRLIHALVELATYSGLPEPGNIHWL